MSIEIIALFVVLPLLGLSLVLSFARLVRGPSTPDRVVALDLFTTIGIGIIAVYVVATDETAFLDAAIVIALLSFLSTIAFARYVERSR